MIRSPLEMGYLLDPLATGDNVGLADFATHALPKSRLSEEVAFVPPNPYAAIGKGGLLELGSIALPNTFINNVAGGNQ